MHYIRFLKTPKLLQSATPTLSAKVAVTTDLGDSLLYADVALIVELEAENATKTPSSGRDVQFMWKGSNGMRSLEISIPIPASKGKESRAENVRLLVRPKEDKYNVSTFEALIIEDHNALEDGGRIVPVRSMGIDVRHPVGGPNLGVGMAGRIFSLGDKEVSIWEETGESIARHIWDSGLALSSCLAAISPLNPPCEKPYTLPQLPMLSQVLLRKNLNILELGAGCGMVGITLSTFFPNASQVLLTDLPEATEILAYNTSLSAPAERKARISHQVLDWASPLPSNVNGTIWDLVVVSDCTYNPDVIPDLVSTLMTIAQKSSKALVLLATKVRHESEMVCFDLLAQKGFEVQEKTVLPLPLLAAEAEQIEIFGLTLRGPENRT